MPPDGRDEWRPKCLPFKLGKITEIEVFGSGTDGPYLGMCAGVGKAESVALSAIRARA